MLFIQRSTLITRVFCLGLLLSFSTAITAQEEASTKNESTDEKKERKARSSFKLSAGGSINDLSLDDGLKSATAVGYNLGLSYKRGRFFYYEIGARFNHRPYSVSESGDEDASESSFSISAIDVPLTGGINITSFADRLIGLRVFVSAVPSFTIGKDVNELGATEDDVNSFMFYGQGGVGIDIAFFFIEVGFNYGFSDIIKIEATKTTPSQAFVNLGFRF